MATVIKVSWPKHVKRGRPKGSKDKVKRDNSAYRMRWAYERDRKRAQAKNRSGAS
jgi:hypothetical protein